MLRFIFSFILTVLSARWIYSELELALPEVVPVVDYALERLEIPTHDKWDRKKIEAFFGSIGINLQDYLPTEGNRKK